MMSTYPHLRTPQARRKNTLMKVLLWVVLMIPASALLYGTSSHVRELQKELAGLEHQIALEQEAVRVLEAEWAYFNNPTFLAARMHKLQGASVPTSSMQIAQLDQLSTKIALRDNVQNAPQIASAQNSDPLLAQGHVVIARNETAQPIAPAPLSTKLLAKPITFSIDADIETDAKIPAAATWDNPSNGHKNILAKNPDPSPSRIQ